MVRWSETSVITIRLTVCKSYCPSQQPSQLPSKTGKHKTTTELPLASLSVKNPSYLTLNVAQSFTTFSRGSFMKKHL